MIKKFSVIPLLLCILWSLSSCVNIEPLSLHPDNPHYFLFRGKPAVLIGSTEHYGAVLNSDFEYTTYLDEIHSFNLNVTRTFSGIYLEPKGAFGISGNTLAPETGKLICPWKRSNQPGYANGGNKFDLDQWDEAYFDRLKNFISEAGKRKIIVELDLFSNFYDTVQWKLSPLYIGNNINNTGNFPDHKEVLSLKHPDVLAVQEKMVRKIVSSLRKFDNLYYEVCNEPYFGDLAALAEWESHMTRIIAEAEKDYSHKHLISHNVANKSRKVTTPDPAVSVLNFHYAKPPVTAEINYGLNKVIGDNETGFSGIEDASYRTEAWDFLTAGGALYNNLDYSFTAGHENGTFEVVRGQPGGGGKKLRSQLKILKDLFDGSDFINMKPMNTVITNALGSATVRVLANEGKEYVVYMNNTVKKADQRTGPYTFSISLPEGNYSGFWINTISGERSAFEIQKHKGGSVTLEPPEFTEDIALNLLKK